MIGHLKFYDRLRRFGFVTGEDNGDDTFFHASQFPGRDQAQPGDRLTYEIGVSKDGRPCAVNVKLVDPHQAALAVSVFKSLSDRDGDHAQEEAAAAFRIDARYG